MSTIFAILAYAIDQPTEISIRNFESKSTIRIFNELELNVLTTFSTTQALKRTTFKVFANQKFCRF